MTSSRTGVPRAQPRKVCPDDWCQSGNGKLLRAGLVADNGAAGMPNFSMAPTFMRFLSITIIPRGSRVGLGESDHHADTPSLDVLQQDDIDLATQLPLLPRFVQQGIRMLNSGGPNGSKEIVRRVVPPAGSNHPVFCLPVVVDDDGVIDEGLLFTEEDGHTRQRRGCSVELDLELAYVGYLVILEGHEPSDPASVRYAAKLEIASLL